VVAEEAAAAVEELTAVAEGEGVSVSPAGALSPALTARMARLTGAMARSARSAGVGAVMSGRWLAETVVEQAGHLPIRTVDTLAVHYPGLQGEALAAALIQHATRASASVGAAAGAVIAMEELLPPAWVALPLEVLVETTVVAAIEMKLIAELHQVYGQPVEGEGVDRAYALALAWAERRGVSSALIAEGAPALAKTLGRGTRNQLIRLVRRRLFRRAGANLATLTPLLIGAAAGAAINRRSTRQLGWAIVAELRP
jgi:hypothetical protein